MAGKVQEGTGKIVAIGDVPEGHKTYGKGCPFGSGDETCYSNCMLAVVNGEEATCVFEQIAMSLFFLSKNKQEAE